MATPYRTRAAARSTPCDRFQISELALEDLQLVGGQFSCLRTALLFVEFQQVGDLFQRETQALGPLDETNAPDRIDGVAPLPVVRLFRFDQKSAPRVVANGLDAHSGLGGQTPYRHFCHDRSS